MALETVTAAPMGRLACAMLLASLVGCAKRPPAAATTRAAPAAESPLPANTWRWPRRAASELSVDSAGAEPRTYLRYELKVGADAAYVGRSTAKATLSHDYRVAFHLLLADVIALPSSPTAGVFAFVPDLIDSSQPGSNAGYAWKRARSVPLFIAAIGDNGLGDAVFAPRDGDAATCPFSSCEDFDPNIVPVFLEPLVDAVSPRLPFVPVGKGARWTSDGATHWTLVNSTTERWTIRRSEERTAAGGARLLRESTASGAPGQLADTATGSISITQTKDGDSRREFVVNRAKTDASPTP